MGGLESRPLLGLGNFNTPLLGLHWGDIADLLLLTKELSGTPPLEWWVRADLFSNRRVRTDFSSDRRVRMTRPLLGHGGRGVLNDLSSDWGFIADLCSD